MGKFFNRIFGMFSSGSSMISDGLPDVDNAIDTRDRAVKMIVASMRRAAGSNSSALRDLVVWVEVPSHDFNPIDYSWADEKMLKDLRLALDNALLSSVGARSLSLRFATADEISAIQTVTVADDQLYFSWEMPKVEEKIPVERAAVSVVGDTGSLAEPRYELVAREKTLWKIGRGVIARRVGTFRRNDIVIPENDPDERLDRANRHVSSGHADILFRNEKFCLRACRGGCRGTGGAPTKIIHGDSVTELTDINALYPLADGDLIELGKSVTLVFEIINPIENNGSVS